MEKIDKYLARELELYYENDYNLHQTEVAWIKNFKRKMKAKKYKHGVAVKAIANNFIPMVITKYRKEFGRYPSKLIPKVSKDTKIYMAERFVRYFEAENRLGNYDDLKL